MDKQQIIILEGHDMTGKTHIAKALSEKLNIPVVKVERQAKWSDPLIELMYGVEVHTQIAQQSGYSFIYDRLYPSEYAYSRTYGRTTSHEQLISVDERFAEMGATIVVFHKDPKSFQEDDKGLIDISKYETLTKWYKDFGRLTKCKFLMIDTTDEDIEKQLEQIIEKVNE